MLLCCFGSVEMFVLSVALALLLPGVPANAPAPSEGWVDLIRDRQLSGWKSIGTGIWTLMSDGTLLGQRDPGIPSTDQAWLYTDEEFGEFDLRFSFWVRRGGNSGISIRDKSRGHYVVSPNWDGSRSPARIAYEIQLLGMHDESWPTGSIYLFSKSDASLSRLDDWNSILIEARERGIRVFVNGALAASTGGDAKRPLDGPIGIQLHDASSVVMIRGLQLRRVQPRPAQ